MISPLARLRHEINTLVGEGESPARRPFLKRSDAEEFLLISDAPQRLRDPRTTLRRLAALGFVIAGQGNLWQLDAPPAWYGALSQSLPADLPAWPEREAYLPVYTLCRTLLAHPARLDVQPFALIRLAVKAVDAGEVEVLKLADILPPRLAVLLRKKEPLPALAGSLLAEWLMERSGKETAT